MLYQLNKAIQKRINRHAHQPEFQDTIESSTERVDQPYQLFPPGNAFLIKLTDEKNGTIEIQKIYNHTSYFGQFVKELNELRHMMKVYKRWIIKYTVDFFNGNQEIIDYYDLNQKKIKMMKKQTKKEYFPFSIAVPNPFLIDDHYFSD